MKAKTREKIQEARDELNEKLMKSIPSLCGIGHGIGLTEGIELLDAILAAEPDEPTVNECITCGRQCPNDCPQDKQPTVSKSVEELVMLVAEDLKDPCLKKWERIFAACQSVQFFLDAQLAANNKAIEMQITACVLVALKEYWPTGSVQEHIKAASKIVETYTIRYHDKSEAPHEL